MVYLEYIVLYFRGASFSLRDRKKVQYVSEVIHWGGCVIDERGRVEERGGLPAPSLQPAYRTCAGRRCGTGRLPTRAWVRAHSRSPAAATQCAPHLAVFRYPWALW